LCNRSAEGLRLDVVRESAPSVDLDHREPLAVLRLERRVAGDVDLPQRKAQLVPQRSELLEGALAKMAALRVVDDDRRTGATGRCHA
jgi:hypothetical protein